MKLNQNNFVFNPIFNALVPNEGPKGLPITMDFTSNASYELDYQNMQERGFMSMVQSIWVDTSGTAAQLTIDVNQSGQQLKIPAKRNGFIALLVPNSPRITFTCASGTVKVILLNVPVSGMLYATE